MPEDKTAFTSEAELVAEFVRQLERHEARRWTVYPETGEWDLILVHSTGFQVGLEAKLILNAKVVDQALKDQHSRWSNTGPDYRGVLVPHGGKQHHIGRICAAIGIGIVTVRRQTGWTWYGLNLPSETGGSEWPNWCPAERVRLPDYIPDVAAGHSAPLKLTEWKIKAIRLMIVLERRGYVTRRDMKSIGISPSRWTDVYHGFLERTPHGYVRCKRTPDLRAQHPTNYAQIEADLEQWAGAMKLEPLDPTATIEGASN